MIIIPISLRKLMQRTGVVTRSVSHSYKITTMEYRTSQSCHLLPFFCPASWIMNTMHIIIEPEKNNMGSGGREVIIFSMFPNLYIQTMAYLCTTVSGKTPNLEDGIIWSIWRLFPHTSDSWVGRTWGLVSRTLTYGFPVWHGLSHHCSWILRARVQIVSCQREPSRSFCLFPM